MLDCREENNFSKNIDRKIILEKELLASKHMQKNSLLEIELANVKKQLEEYIAVNKELRQHYITSENKAIKNKEQLLNLKQTMSYRLGYSLIFGFKSWAGFKNLLSTINLLRREKKGIVQKERVFLEREDQNVEGKNALKTKRPFLLNKYPQCWQSFINEPDGFSFQKTIVTKTRENTLSNLLDKKGLEFSVDTNAADTVIVRFSLSALEPIYADKQAILTIDYLDLDNNSLSCIIDTPYSPALKKYYHYLSVDPSVHNNILLCPPLNTVSIQLSIRLWDNVTDIAFSGFFETILHKTGVSVVIPSYKGEATIIKCLESLTAQTLPLEKFEVIIALNGERDSSRKKIEKYIKRYPAFNIKILELEKAGASYARNAAIKEASYSHLTFVDDDDYVDSNYLSNLFFKARYENITLTGVKDVIQETGNIQNSPIADQLVRASQKRQAVTYHDVTSVLTMNACKMAPTHMVKSILYNENLKSGEDVVYWTKLLTMFSPTLILTDELSKSVYYRVITNNSVSRQEESYDFNVSQRLDVITDLISLLELPSRDITFVQSKINAQSNFIKRFLLKNNELFSKFQREIVSRSIDNEFVGKINELFTERLVISYCFAPYADTSAVVMSKRINQMEYPVDVISNSMNNVRSKDESLHKISSFNIGRHIELNAPQAFSNWNAIAKFAEMVVREVGNIISQRGMYKEIYSRAMWPASHFAAALIKVKYPQVKWIAEFSDPLLMDVTANKRYESLSVEWLKRHGLVLDEFSDLNDNLFYWCEKLAYELSDEIVFTNENQQEYMIFYADTAQSIIENKSKIQPQPTLSKTYYNLSASELNKEDGNVHIGYFGSFYVNRGFDTFFDAWLNLSAAIRSKVRLHIYTQQDEDIVLGKAPADLREYIIISSYVEYFDFLSLSKQFDVLLVMDAKTEGIKQNNPYLPSKVSDYLGSENTILALVEKGSPMSKLDFKNLHKAGLNNYGEIIQFMEGFLTK